MDGRSSHITVFQGQHTESLKQSSNEKKYQAKIKMYDK